MPLNRCFLAMALLYVGADCFAFESDVHYGLTEWLARNAGFDPEAAATIATGDQRVDSGDMQFIDLLFMDACVARHDVGATRAGVHPYPSSGTVPVPPDAQVVAPGSPAATQAALAAIEVPRSQARYRLLLLGEALHILQDSWSHQGVPAVPQASDGS